MKDGKTIQLLLNGERRDHAQILTKQLKRAKRMECLVAFAKTTAFSGMAEELEKALVRGMTARFAIGLDFYLTEPALLRKLLTLSKRHDLKLYLSDSCDTFHPKIYAFQGDAKCSVLIGSANLTYGGLSGNYEASALIEDADGSLMMSVSQHLDNLIADAVVVPANKSRIDAYERAYVTHDAWRKLAKKRAEKAVRNATPSNELLSETLKLMREDDSELGFAKQQMIRGENWHQAQAMLSALAAHRSGATRSLLHRYEELIALFHSGGLHRGKTRIAEHPIQFLAAVSDIVQQRNLPPGDAFNVLHGHFRAIPRAGINLLTEILHALDNKRFAVMNQNAVSGMMRAGITEYPLHPTKQNVTGESYARYCEQADTVRRTLRLANFTELDALFNYVYWDQAPVSDEA